MHSSKRNSENSSTKCFPMFVDLTGKRVLVVGAGSIASRRVQSLIPFGVSIQLIAPELSSELDAKRKSVSDSCIIDYVSRKFEDSDLEGMDFAVVATNDALENARIANLCKAKHIPVNVSSDQGLCDFFFPSLVMDEEIVIGINSGGSNPTKTKSVRRKIEEALRFTSIYNK